MIADDSLFLLIKSLSQAEKRYFKIFAGRHIIGNQNRYVELFNAIERQVKRGTYNEKKIIAFFKNKIAHFPSAKHYLFEMILKSLRAFHDGELIYQQVNNKIADIKLLMRRGLYKKSNKLLVTAKKQAIEIDNARLVLEVLHLERHLRRFIENKSSLKLYKQIETLEKEYIKKLDIQSKLSDVKDHLRVLVHKELTLHDPEVKFQLVHFTKNRILKNKNTSNSFIAQWHYFLIQSDFARLLNKPALSNSNMQSLVSLFEQNPIMQKEYSADYIYILSDYLISCFFQSDFDEFPRVLLKMKNFRIESREDEFLIFSNGGLLELIYLIITNRLEDALQLIPEINDKLYKFRDKLIKGSELAFLSNISAIYFLLERWKDGLDWVNKIILRKAERVRFDIQSAMRILQLIMHYELKNYDLVDYLLRADIRYYKKNHRYFPYEKICLEMIAALLKSPGKRVNQLTLSKYRDKLLEFRKKHKEFIASYSEVLSWIESRISQKPLRSVYSAIQPTLKKYTS